MILFNRLIKYLYYRFVKEDTMALVHEYIKSNKHAIVMTVHEVENKLRRKHEKIEKQKNRPKKQS